MVLHTGQVGVVNIIVKAAFVSGVGSDFSRFGCQGGSHLAQGEHLLATQWPAGKRRPTTPPEEGPLQCTSALCWWLLSFHFRSLSLWPL